MKLVAKDEQPYEPEPVILPVGFADRTDVYPLSDAEFRCFVELKLFVAEHPQTNGSVDASYAEKRWGLSTLLELELRGLVYQDTAWQAWRLRRG